MYELEDYIPPAYKYSSLTIQPKINFDGRNWAKSSKTEYYGEFKYPKSSSETGLSSETVNLSMLHRLDYFSGTIEFFYSNNFGFDLSNSSSYNFYSEEWSSYYNGTHSSYEEKNINYFTKIKKNLYYYPKKIFFFGFSFSPDIRQAPYDFSNRVYKSINNYSASDSSTYHYSRNKRRSNIVNLSLTSDISIGFGRIYNVTNAIVALNMLDRIKALKVGKQPPVNTTAFAKYIDKLKHRRKYETRVALIDDIDSVYSYLNHKGIVDDSFPTTRLIMELADQWQYAEKTIRESGFRIKIYPELNGVLYWRREKQTSFEGYDSVQNKTNYTIDYMEDLYEINSEYSKSDDESGNHKIQGFICSDYTLKKLLNRYVQFNIYILCKSGLVKLYKRYYPYVSHGFDRAFPAGNIKAELSLGYYPNTRTNIILSIAADYYREWDYYMFDHPISKDPAINTVHDDRKLGIKSSLSLSYFINPRFNIIIGGDIDSKDNYSRELVSDKTFNLSFSTGLEYDIF